MHYIIVSDSSSNIFSIPGADYKTVPMKVIAEKEYLDVPNISRIIKDIIKDRADGVPSAELIISEVCRFYAIEEQMIRGNQKTKAVSEARQVAMYLLRKLTGMSTPDIGKEFAKNHTTVLHATRAIEEKLKDPSNGMQDNIRDIQSKISSHL